MRWSAILCPIIFWGTLFRKSPIFLNFDQISIFLLVLQFYSKLSTEITVFTELSRSYLKLGIDSICCPVSSSRQTEIQLKEQRCAFACSTSNRNMQHIVRWNSEQNHEFQKATMFYLEMVHRSEETRNKIMHKRGLVTVWKCTTKSMVLIHAELLQRNAARDFLLQVKIAWLPWFALSSLGLRPKSWVKKYSCCLLTSAEQHKFTLQTISEQELKATTLFTSWT